MVKVPLSQPDITEHEIAKVTSVLRSPNVSQGAHGPEFEGKVANMVGAPYAVATSSGTTALHLIVCALGLGPGDEVITTSFSFVASTNCLLYEGVRPVFVDIDPHTLCLDPAAVEAAVGPRTKAILAVDVFGHPVDYAALGDIARRHNLALIADSCESLGATYHGRPVGHPSLARASAFAFYANKQFTTGEGGIIVTGDAELADMATSLRNQGRSSDTQWLQHDRLGYNYRMDEMSAALGSAQMDRFNEILSRREQVARGYMERLRGIEGVEPPYIAPGVTVSWFVFVIRLAAGIDRAVVMERLAAQGIPSRAYFPPIHRQKYIRDYDVMIHPLPVTEAISRRTLALPFFTAMTLDQIDAVGSALEEALKQGTPTAAD